ncbi:hypothetical protein [Ruminococcus sp. FC2018]|uniref:hypothetical protein n=1 Tax=Ruminococcus sp. FC2018 TaxID=1410617 RepID=UPI00048D92D6|nr:hypothetical protein [Ruminococcus sp. FC2018]
MQYKGYVVRITPADDLKRTDELGRETTCEGFRFEVFRDKEMTDLLDEFSAAVDYEILENSLEEAEQFAKDTIICEEKQFDASQEMSM